MPPSSSTSSPHNPSLLEEIPKPLSEYHLPNLAVHFLDELPDEGIGGQIRHPVPEEGKFYDALIPHFVVCGTLQDSVSDPDREAARVKLKSAIGAKILESRINGLRSGEWLTPLIVSMGTPIEWVYVAASDQRLNGVIPIKFRVGFGPVVWGINTALGISLTAAQRIFYALSCMAEMGSKLEGDPSDDLFRYQFNAGFQRLLQFEMRDVDTRVDCWPGPTGRNELHIRIRMRELDAQGWHAVTLTEKGMALWPHPFLETVLAMWPHLREWYTIVPSHPSQNRI